MSTGSTASPAGTGIVVGAGGGIGSACVALLDGTAQSLLLVDRRPIGGGGASRARSCVADIGTSQGRAAVLEQARSGHGRIAWLVLASGEPLREPFERATPDAIERCLHANLVAPVLLVRELLRLDWEPDAQVIVIGSLSASRALPGRTVYASAKAGLEHFAFGLAAELAGKGLRCNVVAPGVIDTAFLGEDRTALDDWVSRRVPAGRAGAAMEVAHVVRFLVRDAPAYVSGARIAVDGGAEVLG
jgi:NAD(P)-dependent dehydrogenase (short-subunit alcohol dehydrogenase family)